MQMSPQYTAIPSIDEDDNVETRRNCCKYDSCSKKAIILAFTVVTLIISLGCYLHHGDSLQKTQHRVPYGVNFASWLSLEDYFFVGDDGAVEVATAQNDTAARCFPPLVNQITWHSETDLFPQLMETQGLVAAVRAFDAYRNYYFDRVVADLPLLQAMGMRSIRVPMSWCLTSEDPATTKSSQITLDRFACIDPYFAQENVTVYWPAVPKPLVVRFLKECHRWGLKAVLDIQTYPGGTSIGTFSGVWPRPCLFWKYDDPLNDQDVGRALFRDFLSWVESLEPKAFDGLGGITPMNEPAHLAGMFGPGSYNPDSKSFVPDYNLNDESLVNIPDGPHLRVLRWQSDAIQAFRRTSLPSRGIDLIVNVHESIFVPALTTGDGDDPWGRHPVATQIIADWWKLVTTQNERKEWAVLDMHHYHAWEGRCYGTVSGHDAAFRCASPQAETVLRSCSTWAQIFRGALQEPSARLVSGEFSASTHHSVLLSCRDTRTLQISYEDQLQAASAANVDLYFWAWTMPHGGAFRAAWSLRELMHRFDPSLPADESTATCGVRQ
jgi:hypothetical protein